MGSEANAPGRHIRAIRRSRGMTIVQVARALDGRWSEGHLSHVEIGTRTTSPDLAIALAELFDVPVAAIDLRADPSCCLRPTQIPA
jgi:transcriptional regulator with XRE-family HTH domain